MPQCVCRLLDEAVAGLVTLRVVRVLEPVDVGEDEGHQAPVGKCRQVFGETAAIEDAGELVDASEVPQIVLHVAVAQQDGNEARERAAEEGTDVEAILWRVDDLDVAVSMVVERDARDRQALEIRQMRHGARRVLPVAFEVADGDDRMMDELFIDVRELAARDGRERALERRQIVGRPVVGEVQGSAVLLHEQHALGTETRADAEQHALDALVRI